MRKLIAALCGLLVMLSGLAVAGAAPASAAKKVCKSGQIVKTYDWDDRVQGRGILWYNECRKGSAHWIKPNEMAASYGWYKKRNVLCEVPWGGLDAVRVAVYGSDINGRNWSRTVEVDCDEQYGVKIKGMMDKSRLYFRQNDQKRPQFRMKVQFVMRSEADDIHWSRGYFADRL